MTVTTMPGRPVPRDVRSSETARLFALLSEEEGPERTDVLDQIVVLNIQVAHAIARRYQNRGIAIEDLEQVACLALVRAAQKFDCARERDFLSYAVPTMTGEVKRYFRDHGWTIRPPRRIQEIQSRVLEAYKQGTTHGRPPTPLEISKRLDLKIDDVVEALGANVCFQPISIDQAVEADSLESLSDFLMTDDGRAVDAVDARSVLANPLRHLEPEDRRLLAMTYSEGLTQQQIGEILGVTQMTISRRLARILARLRDELGVELPFVA
ncbi:sigma-70 family RNA polymerase sigma factor [Nocardioides sp.]|uniref:sigma-70 family RNA polymerase sigma factor n=1 Tax=Nocardioides sp. TaxID=35761 RepID=UPI00286D0CE1|nr:sigma-70 family RNA polymerase sigma factor [Nocardioides sp.]